MLGCSSPGDSDPQAPGPCDTNTPPAAGNLIINSEFDPEASGWRVCLSVDWVDPGVGDDGVQGTDPPNMFPGGYFSAEFTAATVPSVWLNEEQGGDGATSGTFETGVCSDEWAPGEALTTLYPPPDELAEGVTPDYSDCTDWDGDGVQEREDCFAGGNLNYAVRLRDGCGPSSNVIRGSYALGSGRVAPDEGLSGCMTVPLCPGSDSEDES